MTKQSNIENACSQWLAVRHKLASGEPLSILEKNCAYGCNGNNKIKCKGYKPISNLNNPMEDYRKILFNEHINITA